MAQKNVDATASRKVELAIGELDALSVPPCVAVQYLSKMLQGQFSPASIADIAECEPVLAAELICLAQRLGSGPVPQRHSIRLILDRLGQHRMAMAEDVDGDAAGEVQVALALLADQIAAVAAHRAELAPWVDGHERRNRHRAGSFLIRAGTQKGGPEWPPCVGAGR